MKSFYGDYIEELNELLNSCIATYKGEEIEIERAMDIWSDLTYKIYKNNKTIFFAGNGASATMAEHFGFDAMQNGKIKTINFAETSYLTAISNDISYNDVFTLKLERFGLPDDMIITISSSGNSPNVIRALEYSKNNVFDNGPKVFSN